MGNNALGHATSKDLVNWVDQGIALYPSKDFDANGCFSGSALEVDKKNVSILYVCCLSKKSIPKIFIKLPQVMIFILAKV